MIKLKKLVGWIIFLICSTYNVNAQDIFSGGSGSGDDLSYLKESGSIVSASIFGGGSGAGDDLSHLEETGSVATGDIFSGGNASGYDLSSATNQSITTPDLSNEIYKGGQSKGDDFSHYEAEDPLEQMDLPIELADFEVVKQENRAIIKWITLTEINNDYFILERSKEGKNWQEIMRIDGQGNSSISQKYEVEDTSPIRGQSFYRLRNVDFDGTIHYSDIRSFINDTLDDFELLAYPNPFIDEFTLVLDEAYHSKIEMYAIDGKRINFDVLQSDDRKIKLSLPELRKGVYLIKVASKSTLILMKK
ncbi:T9SS type A sorting domain-containing protein [Flammeovirga agarivorans]|uniref:T9SS type A sorting domain-containing protein n=1 Tax=Flammeovirga agarivorans TaxID=2726742 RepID=A0A7X8SNA7_9BACT|nr:T9SS type A sorting domain-containing protein [Flammeovirga agarivorans]NLR93310.1 T9SS type A sorting domain-containing protein [Flammeovirga agarivorans]